MTARPRTERRWARILIIVLLGNLIGFLTGEALVRVLGHTDEDGNFWLGGEIQGPVRPQLSRLTSLVQELETREEESLVTYDADLGWKWRPGAISENGLYHIDARGVRTTDRATPQRDGPVIALYGGSVTFCTGVPLEESWGHQLEELLAERRKAYRVLNLGVGGYDMGQAYLRWRSTHAELQPEIVIFGLSPENIIGNVSIIRAFHAPNTNLAYSKPRFVLEGNELGVVNVPSLPPREVLEVLRAPQTWNLLPRETFYTASSYEKEVWHHSRLLRVLIDKVGSRGELGNMNAHYNRGTEAFRVSVGIIQRFNDDVRAAGARFVMVHLPNQSQVDKALAGKPMPQAPLLAELTSRGMTVVDPTPELLELAQQAGPAALFTTPDLHFSAQSNRVIAELLTKRLLEPGPEDAWTPSDKPN